VPDHNIKAQIDKQTEKGMHQLRRRNILRQAICPKCALPKRIDAWLKAPAELGQDHAEPPCAGVAKDHAGLPIAYRLYLPKKWIEDAPRRKKAHVPAKITFKTMPQIALEQIRAALLANLAPGWRGADGYRLR
jgi:hypothetical protein